MEKETNVKKRKIGIAIFVGITIMALVIAYVLLVNGSHHECKSQGGLGGSEYDIYYYQPNSEFENIEENEDSEVSYIKEKIVESKKSEPLKKGLIIKSNEDLENYINLLNDAANTDGYDYMDREGLFITLDIDENVFKSKSLIAYLYNNDTHVVDIKVSDVQNNSDSVNIDIAVSEIDKNKVDSRYPMQISESRIIYVLTDKIGTNTAVTINKKNYEASLEKETRFYVDKPIIYLYPETEQEVSVKVGAENRLTCTYPKYNDGWNVIAKPNGDLVDIVTGRNLYALYWEGIDINAKIEKDGFVVKGEDSIKFLEEKLAILGLTEREAEEFIVYWLPKLEANKYNYIRFETMEEIEENMPLIINPMPETIIRIVMNFKGLDKPIKVEEQKLSTPERKGFTAVEWGGTEIK